MSVCPKPLAAALRLLRQLSKYCWMKGRIPMDVVIFFILLMEMIVMMLTMSNVGEIGLSLHGLLKMKRLLPMEPKPT